MHKRINDTNRFKPNNNSLSFSVLALTMIVFTLFISFNAQISAAPEPPTNATANSSRRNISSDISLPTLAGNVTMISLNVTSSSKVWAAYYGNINGTIVLETSSENSIYKWEIDNPRGEVFMVNESISFTNIECWNDTKTDGSSYYNLTEFESWLGVSPDAEDGVNETFSSIGAGIHDEFYVGTTYFAANSCPATSLFNSTGEQDFDKFQEVLLYEPNQEVIVYTAIIEQNQLGFNGQPVDFQLIVGEPGLTDTQTTDYFVYIELD